MNPCGCDLAWWLTTSVQTRVRQRRALAVHPPIDLDTRKGQATSGADSPIHAIRPHDVGLRTGAKKDARSSRSYVS